LDGAAEVAAAQIALADEDDDPQRQGWYTVSVYCDLCLVCQRRDDWDAVAEHAERAESLARPLEQCQNELGEAQVRQGLLGGRATRGRRPGSSATPPAAWAACGRRRARSISTPWSSTTSWAASWSRRCRPATGSINSSPARGGWCTSARSRSSAAGCWPGRGS